MKSIMEDKMLDVKVVGKNKKTYVLISGEGMNKELETMHKFFKNVSSDPSE